MPFLSLSLLFDVRVCLFFFLSSFSTFRSIDIEENLYLELEFILPKEKKD